MKESETDISDSEVLLVSSNKSIHNVTLDIPKGHGVKIIKELDVNISYYMVGSGAKNIRSGLEAIDPLEATYEMTKREHFALLTLRRTSRWVRDEITDEMYSDGISYIPAKYWESDAYAQAFRKGMKLLKEKGLAIKLNKTQYMANQLMIISTRKLQAIYQWNQSCDQEHMIKRDD